MEDYNNFVDAVNNIYSCLAKMKRGWSNADNINYIEKIETLKDSIVEAAHAMETGTKVEELGNDR